MQTNHTPADTLNRNKSGKSQSSHIINSLSSKTQDLSPDDALKVYSGTFPTKIPPLVKGPKGIPFIRNTFDLINNSHQFALECSREYGMVYRTNLFFRDNIVILGGDAFQYVTEDPDKIFSAALGTEAFIGKMFPNSLLLNDFTQHRYQRRVLQAAFKRDSLAGYLDRMNPLIDEFTNHWNTGPESFLELYQTVKSMTLDLATASLLGLELGDQLTKINQVYLNIAKGCSAVIQYPLPGTALRRGLKARNYMVEFLTKLIKERRLNPGNDMVSLLCLAKDDEGNQFSDSEVVDHILGMIFAAHDTTTSSMNSIIFSLDQHPQWQETLLDEYAQFPTKYADYETVSQLEKTGWIFRESTRLYPPVGAIARRNIRPFEWEGYQIPENSWVHSNIYFNHMWEKYWTRPESFEPERFGSERAEHKSHRYAWCPFGGGVHKCLGLHFAEMQVKAILFQLLKKYRFSLKPQFKPQHTYVPVMLPKKGVPVSFTSRDHHHH